MGNREIEKLEKQHLAEVIKDKIKKLVKQGVEIEELPDKEFESGLETVKQIDIIKIDHFIFMREGKGSWNAVMGQKWFLWWNVIYLDFDMEEPLIKDDDIVIDLRKFAVKMIKKVLKEKAKRLSEEYLYNK